MNGNFGTHSFSRTPRTLTWQYGDEEDDAEGAPQCEPHLGADGGASPENLSSHLCIFKNPSRDGGVLCAPLSLPGRQHNTSAPPLSSCAAPRDLMLLQL